MTAVLSRTPASQLQRPGLDGLAREHVVDVQRARLFAALTHVVAEHGADEATVARVVARAGVSRRTFYELFSDVQECFEAAIEDGIGRARDRVLESQGPAAPWAVRIRSGLIALLGLFDEEPALARLLVVESLAGGQRVLERRSQALQPLIAAVEEGRTQRASVTGGLPALTGEGLVGGVLGLIHTHITSGASEQLLGLANELTSMIVLPYQGAAAAKRELDRPLPTPKPVADRQGALPADPFKEAGMRLTYRTMRVLDAIAEQPGASNKRIAEHAEIGDQAQISKLLSRLERMELIVNKGGHGRGERNAWTLTSTGQQVTDNLLSRVEKHRSRAGGNA